MRILRDQIRQKGDREPSPVPMSRCNVCFRHCRIPEGGRGFCGARICKDGNIIPENYGKITSMALDPIEKKPLKRFHPGSLILSVGSYGCNLRCPFCQNYEISWSDHIRQFQDQAQDSGEPCRDRHTEYISPEELAEVYGKSIPEPLKEYLL